MGKANYFLTRWWWCVFFTRCLVRFL